jgi:hypothetical protein
MRPACRAQTPAHRRRFVEETKARVSLADQTELRRDTGRRKTSKSRRATAKGMEGAMWANRIATESGGAESLVRLRTWWKATTPDVRSAS